MTLDDISGQIDVVERSLSQLRLLKWVHGRGEEPNARDLLTLLICASAHECWVRDHVMALLDTLDAIPSDRPRHVPVGGGARGSE